jgi:hypothetical protein
MSAVVRSVAKPDEIACYIEQSTTELRDLALRNGFDFLGYLIDMARIEASTLSISSQGAETGRSPRRPGA